jgi:hypothetical protein
MARISRCDCCDAEIPSDIGHQVFVNLKNLQTTADYSQIRSSLDLSPPGGEFPSLIGTLLKTDSLPAMKALDVCDDCLAPLIEKNRLIEEARRFTTKNRGE